MSMFKLKEFTADCKEPGDCAYVRFSICPYRNNCPACNNKGHLIIIMPNELWFDCAQPASNCQRGSPNNHTCWVTVNDPEYLTLEAGCGGPNSVNMDAGGGDRNWHGYIRNGDFIKAKK